MLQGDGSTWSFGQDGRSNRLHAPYRAWRWNAIYLHGRWGEWSNETELAEDLEESYLSSRPVVER